MSSRAITAVVLLTLPIILAPPASARQKPFTQAQVSDMVKDGFGDESGAKLIEQRGIDFAPGEDFLQSLKAAGADEAFLRALRDVRSPVPGGAKKPLNQVEVFALLASQVDSHRVAVLVEQRGLDFKPTDEYLQEARLAGGADELSTALKDAQVTAPRYTDPPFQARETEVRQYAARGAQYMSEKRYADAEAAFHTAVQLAPQDSDLHLSLAWALGAENRPDQATEECREALRLNPNNDMAHFFLGHALWKEGDADGEITEYRAALRLNPANTLAHLYLGLALAKNEDWEGAIVQYREALRVDSYDLNGHVDFGQVSTQSDKWEGAIAESRKALNLNPNHENTHLNLGLALEMDGDWDAAITEEREAISANPKNALAQYVLGIAFEAKGDSPSALQAYRVAHGLDPQNRDYRQAYERLRGQQTQ